MNEKKNDGAKVGAKKAEAFVTTEAKAQYEMFRNGTLPRETVEQWLRTDFDAIMSLVHSIKHDPDVWDALVEAMYKKYKKLSE